MTHLKDHIDILKSILQDVCASGATVPKSTIYDAFNKQKKTDIEKYRFSKEMSELIHCGELNEYTIKVGRNGGIAKSVKPIKIRFIYPSGDIERSVSPDTLSKIISLINTKDMKGT